MCCELPRKGGCRSGRLHPLIHGLAATSVAYANAGRDVLQMFDLVLKGVDTF